MLPTPLLNPEPWHTSQDKNILNQPVKEKECRNRFSCCVPTSVDKVQHWQRWYARQYDVSAVKLVDKLQRIKPEVDFEWQVY